MAKARSGELRALAQRYAERLPAVVTDVVLTGSVSRGVADELSDIELLAVSDELPPLRECVDAAALDDPDTWAPAEAPVYWIGGRAEGEFVELIWWPRGYVEELVARIAAGEIVDHERLRTAEAVLNGVPLRGSAHAGWRARLARYPEGLAEAIVADAAGTWNEPVQAAKALLRPGDGLMLARRAADDAENILRVVFALNREWEPGWKRLRTSVEPLAVKPERLAERIDGAVRALDLAALRRLAAETLALAPPTAVVAKARSALVEPL